MYHVVVKEGRKIIERRDFAFGEFQEIGWWLNDYELIDERYHVTITFEELED